MQRYQQRELFEDDPDLIVAKVEDQWFDRKSARLDPKTLANELVAFANAEGGTLVIGIEQNGTATGIDSDPLHLNRLQQAAVDFTSPPVRHTAHLHQCINRLGQLDHLLILEIHPSEQLHRNHKGEVFQRFGDQTRKLRDEQARELEFDKGDRPFDGQPATDMGFDDLVVSSLERFASAVGTGNDVERALRARGMMTNRNAQGGITWAAFLLFGQHPQSILPGATIRFLRYDGARMETGTRLNIVFDRRVEGQLPEQIRVAEQIMQTQLREIVRLDERSGRFESLPELPRFAWLEAIVNAVTHRSYSMQGDHIRVSLFNDRLEVESPGRLPGPVRIDNIRSTRYSRNPRLSRALSDLGIVKELNEGMNRMFEEMEHAGLPAPHLQQTESGFRVTLFNSSDAERNWTSAILESMPSSFSPVLERLFTDGRVTTGQVAKLAGMSQPTARRSLSKLSRDGLLIHVATSPRDPLAYWKPSLVLRGRWKAN